MKKTIKTLFILLVVLITSCSDYSEQRVCYSGTLVVLKKTGSIGPVYNLYIFDGKEAKTYQTSREDYNRYNVNDTLPTLVLKTVITKEK